MSSSITSSTSGGTTRITGMVSGLDVDSIVEESMYAEKCKKLYKLQQQEQLVEWKQEQYREVISDITAFADTYLSTTSDNSLIKEGTFLNYTVVSDSSAVSVIADSSARKGAHQITVSQLATAAALKSSDDGLSLDIQGTTAADFTSAQDKSFIITVDGTERTITLDSTVTDVESLQDLLDQEVGEGKVLVSTAADTGALVITAVAASGVQEITLSAASESALSALGFDDESTLSNRIDVSNTLENIAGQMETGFAFNDEGQIALTINGVDFTFDKAETLSEMMSEINKSDAGVTLEYDELADKLILTAQETGAGNTLKVSERGSNFLTTVLTQDIQGQDAKIVLDGVNLTRSSNNIMVDGVTYSLKAATTEIVNVTVEQDTDAIYDTIAGFVEDYNELIESLSAQISEDYDSDYPPLTDDQKAEMSDEEIEKWEKTAKTGLLEDDTLISNLLSKMRQALFDSVPDQALNLVKIGITTGTYDENGKLYIDEETLKKAIEEDPQGVMDLFTQQSTSYSGTITVRTLDSDERKVRYQEEGIAYRIYDILQDNISTYRDSSGTKGLMLEKAGIENDVTEYENFFTEELEDILDRLDEEEDRLDDYEERLYEKYSNLETYIYQMNSQINALLSYTSSGS